MVFHIQVILMAHGYWRIDPRLALKILHWAPFEPEGNLRDMKRAYRRTLNRPKGCAVILWKSSQAAPKASEKLRITTQEHYKLLLAKAIIPDESLRMIFYVDKSTSEETTSYSSAAPESYDILDGPLSNRHFNHWGMGSSSLKSTMQQNISGHGQYFQYPYVIYVFMVQSTKYEHR
ncbi:hypothetical protein RDI58_007221 [Solanum bulbocastanum]|uniref:Uncharacterized protein n=1 Tax=Solanum bulbocastanum TaxID=147425 RepID=A0AAN8YLX4_SOLBU